ncbi:hypothetical protein ACQ4PT_019044 [Festuca glaucescens]
MAAGWSRPESHKALVEMQLKDSPMLSAEMYHVQHRVLADGCCRAGDFGLSLLASGHRLLAHSFRHLTRAPRGIGDDACCKLEKMAVGLIRSSELWPSQSATMTRQKQEQAATPTPALFSLHPTLLFMFSALDSNFQFTSVPTKTLPAQTKAGDCSQGDARRLSARRLSAMDRVKKRHEEKGFLYACFFMLCCCFCCHEACEHCLQYVCCCRSKDE